MILLCLFDTYCGSQKTSYAIEVIRFFEQQTTAFLDRTELGDLSPNSYVPCTITEFGSLVLAHSIDYYPINPLLLKQKDYYEVLENMLERHQKLFAEKIGAHLQLVTDGFNNYFFKVTYTHEQHALLLETFAHLTTPILRLQHLFPTVENTELAQLPQVELPNQPTMGDITVYPRGTLLALPTWLCSQKIRTHQHLAAYMRKIFALHSSFRFIGCRSEDGRLFIQLQ